MKHRRWFFLPLLFLVALGMEGCQFGDQEPPRPASIPKEAFWVGGSDGGVFVVLSQQPSDPAHQYRTKIFRQHGEVWYEGPLFLEPRQPSHLDLSDRKQFIGWDGEALLLQGSRALRVARPR